MLYSEGMNTTTTAPFHCPACHVLVQWTPSNYRGGADYLVNASRSYGGRRYSRGAHECPAHLRDAYEQRQREEDAHLEAVMAADYFDDFGGVADDDH